MLCRHEGHLERIVELNLVPPIELTHILESNGADNPRVASGSEDGRHEALPDLPTIDIVLLSHNHYDHLDVATLTQILERHAGLAHPLWTDPAKRACTLRPDRISQD